MKGKTMAISLHRTIPASPAEVYDAWLDPEHPASPWHGADKLLIDARADGLFYLRHATDGGELVPPVCPHDVSSRPPPQGVSTRSEVKTRSAS